MIKRRGLLLAILALFVTSTALYASDLTLSGGYHWIALASRVNVNDAIEIARRYSAQGSKVVRAKNGWYAAILGPVKTSDIFSFRAEYRGPELPSDALLSTGVNYIETVWSSPSASASNWADCADVQHPE